MSKKQTLLIVNKQCFLRYKLKDRRRLKSYFCTLSPEIIFTNNYRELINAVRTAKADRLFIAGGDGTVSYAINNMNLEDQSLGVIPIGTGNGLAKSLSLQLYKSKYQEEKLIDLISLDYRQKAVEKTVLVHSTFAAGYLAHLVSMSNKFFKSLRSQSYILPVPLAIMAYYLFNNAKIDVLENGLKESFTNLLVNNTDYSGNVRIFPDANLSDGQFDIYMNELKHHEKFIWCCDVYIQQYQRIKPYCRQAKSLSLEFSKPQLCMLDGQIIKDINSLTLKLIPKSLKILV